jgi:hypothetical protein
MTAEQLVISSEVALTAEQIVISSEVALAAESRNLAVAVYRARA